MDLQEYILRSFHHEDSASSNWSYYFSQKSSLLDCSHVTGLDYFNILFASRHNPAMAQIPCSLLKQVSFILLSN